MSTQSTHLSRMANLIQTAIEIKHLALKMPAVVQQELKSLTPDGLHKIVLGIQRYPMRMSDLEVCLYFMIELECSYARLNPNVSAIKAAPLYWML